MAAQLHLYNSLTQKIEPVVPERQDVVTIYVCGITPYDTTHLGHIFTYAASDVLIRYLRYKGYHTKYVQNLTDIDDPILREANEQNEDWKKLGNRWTVNFIEDMKTLNVLPPDEFPRATDVIPDIISTTETLLKNGLAYESRGSVYFNIDAWEEYGKLSRLDRADMLPVANDRGNNPDDPNKRDPLDFELWRAQAPREPSWESPWGPGRPGWHIECSTMARKYLGDTVDIHGGGSDLIFPHHESEIAQSEGSTQAKPFVRHWFHTAMVRHGNEKMSKSLGNLVMVRDLLTEFSPNGLRFYLTSHHYRQPWEFDRSHLKNAQDLTQKIEKAAALSGGPRTAVSLEVGTVCDDFDRALNKDFNTPKASKILVDLAEQMIASHSDRNIEDARRHLFDCGRILGLRLDGRQKAEIDGWNRHLARFQ